jgi:hypothetical protein
VQAEAGQAIRTAIALHPDKWFAMPSFETHFEIALVPAGGSHEGRDEVFERTLDPQDEIADRGWFEVEIPLEAWAGRPVLLELAVSVDSEDGESLLVGGFAEPRLVVLGSPLLGSFGSPVAD